MTGEPAVVRNPVEKGLNPYPTEGSPVQSRLYVVAALIVCSACSKAGSNSDSGANAGSASGAGGTYSAANGDPLSFEFKSNGKVEMNGGPMGSASGTYTVDGEKFLVTMPGGPTYTFIKDGSCVEDQLRMFGKLCIGGRAGDASNFPTRGAPATTGIWIAPSSDGEFRLEFKPDNKLTLTLTPPGGQPSSKDGTFIIEGEVLHVTLDQSEPMVLTFVNGGYETTSFGLPMKFVRQ